jgi:hypothetical protein
MNREDGVRRFLWLEHLKLGRRAQVRNVVEPLATQCRRCTVGNANQVFAASRFVNEACLAPG